MGRGSEAISLSAFRKRLSAHFAELAAHTTSAEVIRSNQEFLNAIPADDDEALLPLSASDVAYQDLKDMFDLHLDHQRDVVEIPDANTMAHAIRKRQGGRGTVIYGVVADGRGIDFLRMGEDEVEPLASTQRLRSEDEGRDLYRASSGNTRRRHVVVPSIDFLDVGIGLGFTTGTKVLWDGR
ncbi:hypothetical protein BJX65DRAFT_301979 [Aspergillus insuetus]